MDNKRTIQSIFIFGILAVLFAVLCRMLVPFFSVILWSVLIYIILSPLHKKVADRLNPQSKLYSVQRHVLAGVFSIATIVVIFTPLTIIAVTLFQQAFSFLRSVEMFIRTNPNFFTESELGSIISEITEKISFSAIKPADANFRVQILDLLQKSSSQFLSTGKSIVSGAGTFLISIVFVIFCLFFLFADGKYLGELLAQAIPVAPAYMTKLKEKFTEITRSLVSGYILVALYQGLSAFIIFKIFGISGALLFSVILTFCSFIPLFGAAIVWAPLGASIVFTNDILRGVVFLALCAVFVSSLDNFLRPFLLQKRINFHPLVIFFAILGGIQVFGINGLILGPLVIILFFTVLELLTASAPEKSGTENETESENASESEKALNGA